MTTCAEHLSMLAVNAFAAVSAVGDGVALMAGLEGGRFPRDMLKGTPFTTYALPGLRRALVAGRSASVATTATLVCTRVGGAASQIVGAIVVGWIIGEAL